MTQAILGGRLGVTNKTVSRWENGNYFPDPVRKVAVAVTGIVMICLGWFSRSKLDKHLMNEGA